MQSTTKNQPPTAPPAKNGASQPQRWKSADCPFVIEYSAELMAQLRRRSVENFYALPFGGLEVGGILFGRVSPNGRAALRVEIAAERPLECAYASGPGFVLSEAETAKIADVIEGRRRDPELAPLSVVGLWISHGRGALALNPDDLDVYRKFFPNPWQIVLVLKPEAFRPPMATFFYRSGGQIAAHRPEDEFSTDPNVPSTDPDIAPEPVPAGRVAESPPPPTASRSGRSVLAGATLAGVLVGFGLGVSIHIRWLQPAAKASGPELGLEVIPISPSALLVHWNAHSPQVEQARSAQLLIEQNRRKSEIALTAAALDRGYIQIPQGGRSATVTLRATGKGGRVEQQQQTWAAP